MQLRSMKETEGADEGDGGEVDELAEADEEAEIEKVDIGALMAADG